MEQSNDLIVSFQQLLEHCGPAAEAYVNINKFWENEEALTRKRLSLEKAIQQSYLPGFTFSSNAHFRWHFYHRDDPFLILRGRTPDTYFENWTRSIMVPSAKHYHAEIAAALKDADIRYRRRLVNSGNWNANWQWTARVRRILATPGFLSAKSTVSEIHTRSIYRWAASAAALRDERLQTNPPSAWRIKALSFGSDFAYRYGDRNDHYRPSLNGGDSPRYFETWVWQADDGIERPICDEWTFYSPALFELWQRPWLSRRPQLTPPDRSR